jgi:hypothetical protein
LDHETSGPKLKLPSIDFPSFAPSITPTTDSTLFSPFFSTPYLQKHRSLIEKPPSSQEKRLSNQPSYLATLNHPPIVSAPSKRFSVYLRGKNLINYTLTYQDRQVEGTQPSDELKGKTLKCQCTGARKAVSNEKLFFQPNFRFCGLIFPRTSSNSTQQAARYRRFIFHNAKFMSKMCVFNIFLLSTGCLHK